MLKTHRLVEGKVVETPDHGGTALVFANPEKAEKRYLVEQPKVDERSLASAPDPEELARRSTPTSSPTSWTPGSRS